MHAESSDGHDYSCETRQGEESSSYGASEKLSSTTHKEKFRKSVSSKACYRGYESRESLTEHFSVNPWAIVDHSHTMRQCEIHRIEMKHCNEVGETKKCNKEGNDELRFNSKAKLQPTRGHIVHSWDVLIDMGTHGLEITLPQLLEITCKSQKISFLSFGPNLDQRVGRAWSWT